MGRLIDTSNIRVKPQYMQDVMGIAMIRCEDLSRILADVPTAEAIPKDQYEARLKADMVAMLENLRLKADETQGHSYNSDFWGGFYTYDDIIKHEINALKGEEDGKQ